MDLKKNSAGNSAQLSDREVYETSRMQRDVMGCVSDRIKR